MTLSHQYRQLLGQSGILSAGYDQYDIALLVAQGYGFTPHPLT